MRKGFTLIELMIVVAIIAVIAAIAIPNLVQSRIASNETSAIASLRATMSGQATFHKTDFYQGTLLQYASPNATDQTGSSVGGRGYVDLFEVTPSGGTTKTLKLVDQTLANAWEDATTPIAKAGYIFDDYINDVNSAAYDAVIEFAIGAVPSSYDRSGRNSFCMDVGGTVFQKDQGSTVTAIADDFPDTSDWIAVGNN